jgi:protein SCO1/2
VYVTVDPERDDAERMRTYLATFDPSFIGGTGKAERLEAVRKEYGILAEKKAAEAGYTVAHSSYTYLIDRDGNLRALMPYGHPADDYVHDIRILLKK